MSRENSWLDRVLARQSQPSSLCLAPRRLSGLSKERLQEGDATGTLRALWRDGVGGSPAPAETGRRSFLSPFRPDGMVSAPRAADSAMPTHTRPGGAGPDPAWTLHSQHASRSAPAASSSSPLKSLPRQSFGLSVLLDLDERLLAPFGLWAAAPAPAP